MNTTLAFLQRMFKLLESHGYAELASKLVSTTSSECFWTMGLRSVDGKEAPSFMVKKMEKKNLHLYEGSSAFQDKFVSYLDEKSLVEHHYENLHIGNEVSEKNFEKIEMTSVQTNTDMNVSKLQIGEFQVVADKEEDIRCKMLSGRIEIVIAFKEGIVRTLNLGPRDISRGITTNAYDRIFLYLSPAGCLSTISLLSNIKIPPMCKEHRRIVIEFDKELSLDKSGLSIHNLHKLMGGKLTIIKNDVANLLLGRLISIEDLFKKTTSDGEKWIEERVGSKLSNVKKLSLVKRFEVESKQKQRSHCDYWTDPSSLISSQFKSTS